MRKLGIYIHIPFCVKKCRYCDFLSFPASEREKGEYVQALLKEIQREAPKYADYTVDTVFIGGGTPSTLAEGAIEEIMACLKTCYAFTGREKTAGEEVQSPEITIEINPAAVDGRKLESYRRAGINRISIGAQSVHDAELAYLGRVHKAADFFRTYREVQEAGFSNINVDLMAALPGQSPEAYRDNLEQVAALKPPHISAYSLMIEEGTPFYELYGKESAGGRKQRKEKTGQEVLSLPSEEEERQMDMYTNAYLEGKGYRRYEISNYAVPGMECRHNIGYWKRKDYAGFGLGAASMVNNVRWKNGTDMGKYMQHTLCRNKTGKEEGLSLSLQEQMEEFMFLGLRLTEGVSPEEFAGQFGRPIEEVYGPALEKLCREGLLETEGNIKLTPFGRDVSNYAMAEFLFA